MNFDIIVNVEFGVLVCFDNLRGIVVILFLYVKEIDLKWFLS